MLRIDSRGYIPEDTGGFASLAFPEAVKHQKTLEREFRYSEDLTDLGHSLYFLLQHHVSSQMFILQKSTFVCIISSLSLFADINLCLFCLERRVLKYKFWVHLLEQFVGELSFLFLPICFNFLKARVWKKLLCQHIRDKISIWAGKSSRKLS